MKHAVSWPRSDLVQVPYKGGGPAAVALITGEVPVSILGILSAIPFMKSGHIRALCPTLDLS